MNLENNLKTDAVGVYNKEKQVRGGSPTASRLSVLVAGLAATIGLFVPAVHAQNNSAVVSGLAAGCPSFVATSWSIAGTRGTESTVIVTKAIDTCSPILLKLALTGGGQPKPAEITIHDAKSNHTTIIELLDITFSKYSVGGDGSSTAESVAFTCHDVKFH
jgi:hypothetical protein